MPNQPSPQPSAPRKANASEALTPSDLSKEGWIRELHPSTCLIQAGSAPYTLLMTMPIWPRAKTTAELRDSFKESATALGLYDEANPHAEANYTRAVQRYLQQLGEGGFLFCRKVGNRPTYGIPATLHAALRDTPQHQGIALADALRAEVMIRSVPPIIAKMQHQPTPDTPFSGKIAVISETLPHQHPEVNEAIFSCLAHALAEGHKLVLAYVKQNGERKVDVMASPLALMQRGPMLYLLCRLRDNAAVAEIALSRITKAQPLPESPSDTAGFSLAAHMESGRPQFCPNGEKLAIKLRLFGTTAMTIRERPIADDQVVSDTEDDAIAELTATVFDSAMLRWWLLGLGTHVEVLAPPSLRQEMCDTLTHTLAHYTA